MASEIALLYFNFSKGVSFSWASSSTPTLTYCERNGLTLKG